MKSEKRKVRFRHRTLDLGALTHTRPKCATCRLFFNYLAVGCCGIADFCHIRKLGSPGQCTRLCVPRCWISPFQTLFHLAAVVVIEEPLPTTTKTTDNRTSNTRHWNRNHIANLPTCILGNTSLRGLCWTMLSTIYNTHNLSHGLCPWAVGVRLG